MTRLTGRPTRATRALVLLSAFTLAVGLSPSGAPSAAAEDPAPAWTFLAPYARSAPVGSPMESALRTGVVGATDPFGYVTPAGVSPTMFDVSADGSTLAVAGFARGADAWATPVVGTTQGLAYVRRTGGVTSSLVVATHWSLNPVLSSDGASLWWTYQGVVYRHASGVTTRLAATLFLPLAGETMTAFSVSPDGTKGSALYWSAAGARLLAADFLAGRGKPHVELRFPTSVGPLATDCFSWLDDTQVLFRPVATPTQIRWAPMAVSGSNSSTIKTDSAGWYYPRLVGTQWWVWDQMTNPWGPSWSYRVLASPLEVGAAPVRTGTTQVYVAIRSVGPVVSLTTPPTLGDTADVRAPGAGRLTLSASVITYGQRAYDIAYGQYIAVLPGQSLATSGAKVAGMLQVSYDGTTWRGLRWNSLPVITPWWGSTVAANGYVTVTRSVWVRYRYSGDPLVSPMVSPVRRLTVTPLVRVRIISSSSGRSRLVSGTVTRIGGRALLYRYVGGRYVVIAQTSISGTGRYAFAWRTLPHGSYKVASVADSNWNAGRAFFRI